MRWEFVALLRGLVPVIGFLALAAIPATATAGTTTFNFDGGPNSGTTASALNFTSGTTSVSLKGYTFANSLSPASLDSLNLNSSTFAGNATLSYSSRGVGICSSTETGGTAGNSAGCPEIDSADEQGRNRVNLNEGMLLSFTGSPTVNLLSAVLNIVDSNDTLGIYGVTSGGTLDFLGFAGTITNPVGGFTVIPIGSNTNAEYQLTFTPALSNFSNYFFTTMTNGTTAPLGDGYRLRSLTIQAVPEPATWALMLFGFGLIGFQMRRSRGRKILAVAKEKSAAAF